MHHAEEKSPKEQIRLNARPECTRDDVLFGEEVLVAGGAQIGEYEQRERERAHEIEQKAVEAGQTDHARRAAGQGRHGRLTVVEQIVVVADGRVAQHFGCMQVLDLRGLGGHCRRRRRRRGGRRRR